MILFPFSRQTTHFVGIAIVAFCIMAYQVLLTRIFSVVLFYHYAFAGISLAMLGLTMGAQRLHYFKDRFSAARLEIEWVKAALGFAVSMVGLTLGFLFFPYFFPSAVALMPVLIYVFIVPFFYGGICVSLILTRSETPVGKLYAADLAGASFGCLGIVAVLFLFDPITVLFGLAFIASLTAWMMAAKAQSHIGTAKCLVAVFFILFATQGALYQTNQPHLHVMWAKGNKLEQNLFERWNTFSLVRVYPEKSIPFGWGFGHTHLEKSPDQLGLDIDAQAGTTITKFDGNLEPLSYLADDVINAGYNLRPAEDVAVIGVGGGRDILSALYFHTPHIVGVELNPSIFEALTKKFAGFSGHLDQRPDVSLVNAEARSWINQGHRSFDVIQISLIDTWAATAAGGLSMSENKLYTVNAWKDFLDHLTPNGFLSVSRWFDATQHTGELYRMLSLAADTLKQRGVSDNDIKNHVLVFAVDSRPGALFQAGVATLIISPSALTADELENARKTADAHGFRLLVAPDFAWDSVSRTIISGAADDAFYEHLPLDLKAPTDDRPFFFHMARMKDLIKGRAITDDMSISGWSNYAVKVMLGLLVTTIITTLYFTFVPMADTWKTLEDRRGLIPFAAYFAAIGLGFMLIEISQMQRLMIFLGHPVYGLTIVLFTLLLFGGIGSLNAGRFIGKPGFQRWLIPAALCFVLALLGLLTPLLTEQFKIYGILPRMIVSIALLAPAAFCMGMMFPLGMTASMRYRELQPWLWSVNGAFSVFGTILGTVISMELGIADAFWTGFACYLLCIPLIYKTSPRPAV